MLAQAAKKMRITKARKNERPKKDKRSVSIFPSFPSSGLGTREKTKEVFLFFPRSQAPAWDRKAEKLRFSVHAWTRSRASRRAFPSGAWEREKNKCCYFSAFRSFAFS